MPTEASPGFERLEGLPTFLGFVCHLALGDFFVLAVFINSIHQSFLKRNPISMVVNGLQYWLTKIGSFLGFSFQFSRCPGVEH